MRARQRHLNPRFAGASLVLDSRYITDISDGSGVSTWSDLSGNGYNATQSTGTKQPLFKVNLQGGQPGLLFDGSNDSLATAYGPTSGDVTVFVIWKANLVTVGHRRIMDKDYANGMWFGKDAPSVQSYGAGCRQSSSPYGIFIALDNTNTHLLSAIRSGASWTVTSESQSTVTTTVSSTVFNTEVIRVGDNGSSDSPWNGNIFCVFYFHNLALETSILRRMFHSYGHSFKIACS